MHPVPEEKEEIELLLQRVEEELETTTAWALEEKFNLALDAAEAGRKPVTTAGQVIQKKGLTREDLQPVFDRLEETQEPVT